MSSELPGPSWPWPTFDLSPWISFWSRAISLAPQILAQPIFSGWTVAGAQLTVNHGNSSAPEVEAEVVQRHSYGRQLGRLADALEVLIRERGDGVSANPSFKDFLQLKQEIDLIKRDASADRISRLRADLAMFRLARPDEYRRLRDELRRALED
jgi:hypothetical protein